MATEDPLASLLDEGLAAQRGGRDALALAAFERCLDASPAHAAAHLHAALSSYRLGRWEMGLAHARVAAAREPQRALAWARMAKGLRALGRAVEAQVAAQRALALEPRLADAWSVLGLVAQDAGDFDAARAAHRRALENDPRDAEARMDLALCDEAQGDLDAALEGFREAAALDPALADVPYNRGHLQHVRAGRIDAAIASYREAIAMRPGFAQAHHNLAHALFLSGDFPAAWREYRWRPPRLRYEAHERAAGRAYALPDPASLAGARLRIVGEQGLGDTIFFLRFAPLLRAKGAVLEFAGDARLASLLARTGLFDSVDAAAEDARGVPAVLAGDLPELLAEAGTGGAPPPLVLVPDPGRVARARERLDALGPAPHVALAWRAGIAQGGAHETLHKELPVGIFGKALAGMRATWISVQREPRAGETEALSRHAGAAVHDLSGINEDLEDALAYMSVLGGWIGVSNTNVHLRAATGGAALVLVPFPPEWRWMAAGDSPWFPGMRVYRQEAGGSWDGALSRLAAGLR